MYRSYAISSSKSKWIIFITHLKEIITNSKFTGFNFNNFKTTDPNNLPLIPTNSKKFNFNDGHHEILLLKRLFSWLRIREKS